MTENKTPPCSNNLWERPTYVPPPAEPVRGGGEDALKVKTYGDPT